MNLIDILALTEPSRSGYALDFPGSLDALLFMAETGDFSWRHAVIAGI